MFRAVILAAGKSERMGEWNKLLMPLGDKLLIEHAIEPLTRLEQVQTVLVCSSPSVAKLGAKWGIETICSKDTASQSQSLIQGLNSIDEEKIKGIIFALGDQPFVASSFYRQMLHAYHYLQQVGSTRNIIVSSRGKVQGAPVLLSSVYLPQLRQLTGDEGARSILGRNRQSQFRIAPANSWSMLDIDHMEDYREAVKIHRKGLFHEGF